MDTLLPDTMEVLTCNPKLQIFLEENQKFISDVSREVFAKNEDLCRKLSLDVDDLAQIGQIKLCRKSDAYKSELGASFKTFCKKVMQNAMIDVIRHEQSAQRFDMEHGVILCNEEPQEELRALYSSFRYELPEPSCLRRETLQELKAALEQASDRDRIYLTYRFGLENGEEHSPEASAKYFHLTKHLGKKTENDALKHLRENMP